MEATVDDTPALPRQNFRLPTGAAYDRLTPLQRRAMVGAIVAAHVAAVWALLQIREVRDAVADVGADLRQPGRSADAAEGHAAAASSAHAARAPPDRARAASDRRRADARRRRRSSRAAARAGAARARAGRRRGAVAPVAPPPAPAPPRNLSASAVQYLEPLQVEYPRLSKRLGETGVVMLRVFIDEAGRVRDAQVSRTSGHPRLDDAAMAAVQKARFKPPSENGQAVSGYAQVPVDFQLEK